MQLFCHIFLCSLCCNGFRAKKKLKKSVKKFALYCFLSYLYTIRKIKKVITIKNQIKMKLKKSLKERQIEALIGGNIEKWNRYMTWCRRKQWYFKADLSGADLRWADLSGADLSRVDLSGANLSDANLFKANLIKANLNGANLFKANLNGANLIKANLSRVDLSGANLNGANLIKANLNGANLNGANLKWADLSDANLNDANLSGANLSEANLSGADLDYSSLPLWCGSLKMKTDAKQRKQIAYHLASLFVNSKELLTDEEKQLLDVIKPYANQFHRVWECDKIIIKRGK